MTRDIVNLKLCKKKHVNNGEEISEKFLLTKHLKYSRTNLILLMLINQNQVTKYFFFSVTFNNKSFIYYHEFFPSII